MTREVVPGRGFTSPGAARVVEVTDVRACLAFGWVCSVTNWQAPNKTPVCVCVCVLQLLRLLFWILLLVLVLCGIGFDCVRITLCLWLQMQVCLCLWLWLWFWACVRLLPWLLW